MDNLSPEKKDFLPKNSPSEEEVQNSLTTPSLSSSSKEEKLPCETVEDLLPLYQEKILGAVTANLVERHLETCTSCKEKLNALIQQETLTCDTIKELLPLYKEGLVGEKTKELIENHLKTCSSCRKESSNISNYQSQEEVLTAFMKEKPLLMKNTIEEELPPTKKETSSFAPLKKMKKELSRRRRNAVFLAISAVLLIGVLAFTLVFEPRYLSYQEEMVSVVKEEDGSLSLEIAPEYNISGWHSFELLIDNQPVPYYAFYTNIWQQNSFQRVKKIGIGNSIPSQNNLTGMGESSATITFDETLPKSIFYMDFTTKTAHLLYGAPVSSTNQPIPYPYGLQQSPSFIWNARLVAIWAVITALGWLFLNLLYKYKAAALCKYLFLVLFSILISMLIANVIAFSIRGPGVMGATVILLSIPLFGVLVFGLALIKQSWEDRKK